MAEKEHKGTFRDVGNDLVYLDLGSGYVGLYIQTIKIYGLYSMHVIPQQKVKTL